MPATKADVAQPSNELAITRRTEAGSEILAISGEIDLGSAPTLGQALQDAERALPSRVVLDLAGVRFMDSTAIHLLIEAQRRAEANGHELVLARSPAHAQRLFALTGIISRLTIE